MAGLHLYRSNRVEELAVALGELLQTPLPDPLQPELVVVQSLGMRRWLSFRIARRLGVAMNCDFPFFVEFAQRVFRSVLPAEGGTAGAFTRDALLWRILSLLPELLPEPAFAPLRRYVGEDEASALKSFQLARQLATVFDQYLAYTPERLLQWEQKREAGWQPHLWRRLAGDGAAHPAALLHRLHAQFAEGAPGLRDFPPRLAVFGIASLPPFYLRLLGEVCRATEVHLFLFEPTDQYWGDLRSAAEQRQYLRRHGRTGQTAEALHLEAGNELLASFGRAGRAFSSAVMELDPAEFHEEGFQPPSGATLLGRLQADIYHLREAGAAAGEPVPDPADGSVRLHSCHGPLREVEVLHDQLLDLLAKHPGLTPKDILVTMPNVETHAPFIEAVFGSPEDEARRIPYTIADRSVRARSGLARTFLRLLDLHGSRFTAGQVLELLEAPAVRERFGIEEAELETIRAWIGRTGIRWGIDASHRSGFELPEFSQNSWRSGLDRLLLGYAWAGEGGELFEGLLPDSDIEGHLAELLGRFAEFAEALFERVPRLATPRSPAAWSEFLLGVLSAFFSDAGEESEEVLSLRHPLAALAAWEEYHPGEVPLPVLRAHLATVLEETETASGFIAGHVTFCSLKPMRSIPFRVVCLLGMGDGEFPRRDTPIAFDLLAEEGGGAGRSRRDEDRQLFLEALLSARDVFYLSWTGLSARDNSELPPSVVVSEIVDYLTALVPGTERDAFLTHHRLQPFSPAYYGTGPLFSYSRENSEVYGAEAPPESGACGGTPLPPAELDWQALELRALSDFLCHPARYFVQRRLGARLPEAEEALGECEPLALDTLEQWQLARRLAEGLLAGRAPEQIAAGVHAAGLLPAGHFGAAQLEELRQKVDPLVQRIAAAGLGAPLAPRRLSAGTGEWQLHGTLDSLHEGGLRCFTAWELKPRDRLQAWVRHLLLNAGGPPAPTWIFATDQVVKYEPRADALALLGDLVALLREGLTRPLPLFAKSSYDFASRTLHPRKNAAPPALAARKLYEDKEANDAHHQLCFRHLETPCGREWEELALRVWSPILTP